MPAHRGPGRIEHDPEDCPLCEVYPRGGYMRGEYWRELGADALRAENERLWGIEGKYNAVMAENERLRAALINMLDDGDETDRAQALAALGEQAKD